MACWGRIRQEFRLESFRLNHADRHDFTRSPWFDNQGLFVVYRTLICLYQICTYATAHSLYGISEKSFIYLTEQGFIILSLHTIVSALLCYVDYFGNRCCPAKSPDDNPTTTEDTTRSTDVLHRTDLSLSLPWYFKAYWVLYNVAFCAGLFITIAFWALIGGDTSPYSVLFHGINVVVVVIDVFASGLPLRLLHFVFPSCYALAYIVFTAIYWAAGGTDFLNRPWIYPFIDYGGNPGLAAGTAVLSVVLAIPLCHVVIFGLALSRETLARIARRRCSSVSFNLPMEPDTGERA